MNEDKTPDMTVGIPNHVLEREKQIREEYEREHMRFIPPEALVALEKAWERIVDEHEVDTSYVGLFIVDKREIDVTRIINVIGAKEVH